MPQFRWTDSMIRDAVARVVAGEDYGAIGDVHGVSRDAVSGLIYRLRFRKDHRLPASLIDPASIIGFRHPPRPSRPASGPTVDSVARLPPIDERNLDRLRHRAAIDGCARLLTAQLRAGQHLLAIPLARAVAERMGIDPCRVRPGIGDPLNIGASA